MARRGYVSEHHKDQLLDVLFHYLPMEQRGILIQEVPAAYNAYVGRNVFEVVRVEDGSRPNHQRKLMVVDEGLVNECGALGGTDDGH